MPVNYDQDLILVTCASGKQAADVILQLIDKWKRIRLQVNSDKSKQRLQSEYPSTEVVQADLFDPHDAPKLLEGVTACFLNCPPFRTYGTIAVNYMVDAAMAQRKAGGPFSHMLYSSVLFPVINKLTNHATKALAEEYLVESQLPYTILQPSHFMENFPLAKILSEEHPIYPAAYDPNVVFTWTSTKDLGEAAARVLEQREKHFYATYQCVSTPTPMTYVQAIDIVSKEIGKKIEIQRVPLEKVTEIMLPLVIGEREPTLEAIMGLKRLISYYNERGLVGNCNVLEWLLGHKALTYEAWAKIKVKEVREQMQKAQ